MSYKTELKSARKSAVAEMSRIMEGKTSLSNGERARFDSLKEKVDTLSARISGLTKVPDYRGVTASDSPRNAAYTNRSLKTLRKAARKYRPGSQDTEFTSFLRGKSGASEFRTTLDANSMSTAPNSSGISAGATGYDAGYLIPQGFWTNLQVALKAYGGISGSFRYVETPTGNPMPWPTVDPTAIVGKYITESNQLGFGGDSAGTDYQFGQGMLNAWTIVSGVILASVQLIQDSAFDVDSFVADRIGEAIGRKLAAESVSGSGSSAMLGLNTALNARGALSGASGGFYQLTAATTVKTFGGTPTELVSNTLSPTSLLGVIAGVDPAYYPTAKWYLNAIQAWNLRSVVDSNGRPLINFANGFDSDSVTGPEYNSNAPVARLFGFPVVIDNSIPNLSASTTGGPIFGSLGNAMVFRVVRNDARIVTDTHPVTPTTMKLTERYADYLQVGYLGFLRCDSRSNDLRAACTIKCAAT